MKKMLVLLALVVSVAQAYQSPLIAQFKDGGIIKMQGPCIYKQSLYTCMLVESKGKSYILMGKPDGESFNDQYILEVTGPESSKEVWAHHWKKS